MSSSVEDVLTCPICFELFTEEATHSPCIIQCGHTVCFKDLSYLVAHSSSGLTIQCPICREDIPIVDGKAQFKPNYTIIALLSAKTVSLHTDEQQKNKKNKKKKNNKKNIKHGTCMEKLNDSEAFIRAVASSKIPDFVKFSLVEDVTCVSKIIYA